MTVEQDGEYLHEAHQIIAEELASGGPVEDELDAATAVIDGLHAAGCALVNEAEEERADAEVALSVLRKMAAIEDCWMLERFASSDADVVGHAAIEATWFTVTEDEMVLLERLAPN